MRTNSVFKIFDSPLIKGKAPVNYSGAHKLTNANLIKMSIYNLLNHIPVNQNTGISNIFDQTLDQDRNVNSDSSWLNSTVGEDEGDFSFIKTDYTVK